MNENHVYDMIIVGGGPGGYTSALYAARAGFETIVLEKFVTNLSGCHKIQCKKNLEDLI